MVQPSTLKFLNHLAKNNNKAWFDEHRDEYAAAKADFEDLVNRLLQQLAHLEPAFRNQTAKDCVFRIFRDVRFSKDKTPYKAHFGAYLSKEGRKYDGPGYYIHIEANNKSFAGGGLWYPQPALLKKVRQEIDYNLAAFQQILKERSFKKYFKQLNVEHQLKTLPQGYSADNPAIDYLKMKSFTVGHELKDEEVTGKNFTSKCADVFTAMKPLVDFLNSAMD